MIAASKESPGSGSWYMSPWRSEQLRSAVRARFARHVQHLAREIDADRVFDARRQDLQHAARPSADVEQLSRVGERQQLQQRALDLDLIDMEGADASPLRGIGAEIGGCLLGAGALDLGQALMVEEGN